MKKLLPLLAGLGLLTSIAHADDVIVSTRLTSVNNCRVDHTCDQQASHDIQIINDTAQNHYYVYNYSICAVSHCESITGQVYVNAHTRWNNHHDTVAHFVFDRKMPVDVVSNTSVDGTESHTAKDTMKIQVG